MEYRYNELMNLKLQKSIRHTDIPNNNCLHISVP